MKSAYEFSKPEIKNPAVGPGCDWQFLFVVFAAIPDFAVDCSTGQSGTE